MILSKFFFDFNFYIKQKTENNKVTCRFIGLKQARKLLCNSKSSEDFSSLNHAAAKCDYFMTKLKAVADSLIK